MFESIFQMMRTWDKLGQAVFLLIVLGAVLGTIHGLVRYIVIALRGWPPPNTPGEAREERSDEA